MQHISFHSRNITSCYGCTERQVGCHSTCERYLKDREEQDKHTLAEFEGRKKQYAGGADMVLKSGAIKQWKKKQK